MKNKIVKAIVCCLAILLLLGALPVAAAGNTEKAQVFFDGIVAYKMREAGAATAQEWIDGDLTNNAGSSEWYVIALSQYGEYDFSAYEKALLKYLAKTKVTSASSRQKYTLALVAVGSTDTYIHTTLQDTIGQQGIMSFIFGLHLLNNGYESEAYSIADVKTKLLSLQLDDGGFAVSGRYGDVDATAMAVQALAPYYTGEPAVKAAVDAALSFLSNRQNATGDYASFGVSCPESTAQVLTALSALGIDPMTDSRFIKNGNTLFDGMGLYQLSDGSFSHTLGGKTNGTATVQVLYATVSYLRMQNGDAPLFILDGRNPGGLQRPTAATVSTTAKTTTSTQMTTTVKSGSTAGERVTTTASSTKSGTPAVTTATATTAATIATAGTQTTAAAGGTADTAAGGYKPWVCLAIAVIAGGTCAALYMLKKRNFKNYIVIFVIAAVMIAVVLLTDFQTTATHYAADTNGENSIGTVTVTIRCDTVPDKSSAHIPDDGSILDMTAFDIAAGDTVYDLLFAVTAANKIHLESSGGYVQGIGNLYEFDYGDLSGWVYHVNGESPSVGCDAYTLSAGDTVEWLYTLDLGNDLK